MHTPHTTHFAPAQPPPDSSGPRWFEPALLLATCGGLGRIGRAPGTFGAAAGLLAAAGLAGTAVPFEADFSAFLARWRALELDAVVHPYGATANIGNKSAASLLVASYLGAVPVVGDEPAYAGLGEAEGVLKVAPRPEAWAAALERLSDATTSAQLRARLRDWCRASFGPQPTLRALDHLASLPAPRRRWRQWLWGRLAP